MFLSIFSLPKGLKIYAKKTKKKQHYRYSQSRWNTSIVVSSISKIGPKQFFVKFRFKFESGRGGRSAAFKFDKKEEI